MTIETKYNIGDEVWCQTHIGVRCVKIYSIDIDNRRRFVFYLKGKDIEGWCFEYELFSTKEELLKSL